MVKRRRDTHPGYPAEWHDPTFKGRTTEEQISLSLLRGVGRLPPLRRFVYFLHAPALDLIKIGIAENVEARRKVLAKRRKRELITIGYIEGAFADEAAWHARFANIMVEREWFRDTPELREAIAASLSVPPTDGAAR
jgi:hypothetical protein